MSMETYKESKPFLIVPDSLNQAIQLAKIIASSDLAPKQYKNKWENCLIAMQMGAELGLSPLQSLQNIDVINGRPCVWGDAMLALVRSSPDFHSLNEWNEGSLEQGTYIAFCEAKNKTGEIVKQKFSYSDAKRACLLNKTGAWQQYPERMFQMRARGFACRDLFPHALKGLSSAEEVIDIPVTDYKIVNTKKSVQAPEKTVSYSQNEQYDEIKYIIETAEDIDDLQAAADLCKNIDEHKKPEIRALYKEKLNKLKESTLQYDHREEV